MSRTSTVRTRGVWEREPGSGVWWIRYRIDGALKREKVGRKSDAVALYQKRKSEARAGVKLPENLRRSEVRFSSLATEVSKFSEKHHRDRRTFEGRLKRISADFGDRVADQIKPADIDAWLAQNTSTPATANRYRALFSLVFREAVRNGRAASNPARLVRMRHEDNGRIRFLTDKEEQRLRKAIGQRFPEHLPELIIALGTGMRLSEQFNLTWEQLDLSRKEINLDRTKNGSARTIPMNAAVYESFKQLKARSPQAVRQDHVFAIKNPRMWFHTAMHTAKVENYRWHDNRHTFCSRLAMRGQNLKVIQQLAGHKTIQMSARYAHLGEKSLRSAVDKL